MLRIKRDRKGSPSSEANLTVVGRHGNNQYIKLIAKDGLEIGIGSPHLAELLRQLADEIDGSQEANDEG